ncbi:MAG TPA: ABC transporter permease [Anaerolineae bacterium]|nr:ABC transporter permease [Anaerolineae bacterium]
MFTDRASSLPTDAQKIKPKQIIEPKRGWAALNLKEIVPYRELLYFLTWRDIKVRYKQTAIGAAWAILQPFLTMIVFSIVFGRLVGVSSDGVPYPLFSFAGLLPWTFFATALGHSGTSLVSNSQLISKVYFPRLILPIAAVIPAVVDFAIAFVFLIGLLLWYGITPSATIVTLPLFLLLAFVTVLGVGIWLSALDVKYRDIRYLIPFVTQFWLFVTPVAYPSSYIPAQWRALYALNPMVGVVEGFRWALLGQSFDIGGMIFVSAAVSFAILITGLFYFRRMERQFADLI